MRAEAPEESRTNNDESVLLADLAALHDRFARYVLGYAYALLGSRERAEEVSIEVLLTGWRAGLAREVDECATRLLLISLLLREVGVLRRQRAAPTSSTLLQAGGLELAPRVSGRTS